LRLDPDDFAPKEETEVILQDSDDIGRQGPVGLPAQVGDVDGDPATRLEHPLALGEDVAKHLQVVEIGRRHAVLTERLFVRLAGEVRRRRDDECDGVVRKLDLPGVGAYQGLAQLEWRPDVIVGGQLRGAKPCVEVAGIVTLSAADTKPTGRRHRVDPSQ
jgi:hypothetical protein